MITNQFSRYLITTADERTWKFDRPVIFLGEWCRIYDRKHIWQGMDAIVAAPYGLTQSKKDADYASHTGSRRRPHPASLAPPSNHPQKLQTDPGLGEVGIKSAGSYHDIVNQTA
jgi:hypothetical protein